MRERDVGDAFGRRVPGEAGLLERGIAFEKGVDKDHTVARLEPEARVSEPDDLHARPPGAMAPFRAAQYKDRVRDNNNK
jgi:hypothetical protein